VPDVLKTVGRYSVGCMACELLAGRVPSHDSEAPMAILLRHLDEPIPPVDSGAVRGHGAAGRA
jgi:hypothetical protein